MKVTAEEVHNQCKSEIIDFIRELSKLSDDELKQAISINLTTFDKKVVVVCPLIKTLCLYNMSAKIAYNKTPIQ